MHQTIEELKLGSYDNIATVRNAFEFIIKSLSGILLSFPGYSDAILWQYCVLIC